MKIQFTAKETRKLNSALITIKAAVEGVPFLNEHIKSSKHIGQRFTIKEDGSSEVEFKEKIVTAFLDSGAEAFIESGKLIKSSYEKLRGIWKSFENDLDSVENSLIKSNQGFITGDELAQYRRQKDDDDVLKMIIINKEDRAMLSQEVEVDDVPMSIRLYTAIAAIENKQMSLSKAAKLFKVPFHKLKKHFK